MKHLMYTWESNLVFWKSNTCFYPLRCLISSDMHACIHTSIYLFVYYWGGCHVQCLPLSSESYHRPCLFVSGQGGDRSHLMFQASHEFLWSSCLYLPSAEMTGMHHQAWQVVCFSLLAHVGESEDLDTWCQRAALEMSFISTFSCMTFRKEGNKAWRWKRSHLDALQRHLEVWPFANLWDPDALQVEPCLS